MKYIYFKREDDLFYFCDRLFRRQSVIDVRWEKTLQRYYKLHIAEEQYESTEMIACLTDLYMEQYLIDTYVHILEKVYFIEKDSMIESLLHMIDYVSHDSFYLEKTLHDMNSIRHHVQTYVRDYVEKADNIYFDAMIRFHFAPMKKDWIPLIGFAIDEWHREEEHQLYMERLRTFVRQRPTMRQRIHVLKEDGKVHFYEEDGTYLPEARLHMLMENYPLYMVGLDEKEQIISPIITLAPKQILLYGTDQLDQTMQTIVNVFEERVSHLPLSMFPFASK